MRHTTRWAASALALLALSLLGVEGAYAHGVAQDDASFFLTNVGPAIGPFMYLGAKHMFTGYDHILFLVGVLFFLYRLRDVVAYVSLFTLGHSVTLLAGVLWGIHANAYVVDAIIGLSVVYKAFDNMDGFRRLFGVQPDTKAAVLVFGLFHGFGLATTLQEYAIYSVIPPEGCAAILWRDSGKKIEAATALKLTAPDLLARGIIDEIVREPIGGAHTSLDEAAMLVDGPLHAALEAASTPDVEARLARRYEKFRDMGRVGADFTDEEST